MPAALHYNGPMNGARDDRPEFAPVDSDTLPRLLRGEGFQPPEGFKALVVELPGSPGEAVGPAWDWQGTSRDDAWWPASTVKILVAAAALSAARRLGFSTAAAVRFDEPEGPHGTTLEALVRAAVTHSDNAAFDRLAFVAGHAGLRRWLARQGFAGTSLWRGYSGLYRDPATGRGTLTVAPALVLCEGHRTLARRPRIDRAPCDVPEHGSRTTLQDLAECLRRIVLHPRLAPRERLGLRRADAVLLQDALAAPRERGRGVADGLRSAFGDGTRILHKPGFACDWFSDVAFVEPVVPGPRWIVAMAGRPGRDCLDDAARRVGRILAAKLTDRSAGD
jgi:beta-lactamase class A